MGKVDLDPISVQGFWGVANLGRFLMRRANLAKRCLFILLPFIILLCSNSLGYAEWKIVDLPYMTNWELYKLHFISADEGWAIGVEDVDGSGGTLSFFHYSYGSWTSVPLPNLGVDWDLWDLFDVFFVTPDVGWAVGVKEDIDFCIGNWCGKSNGAIFQYYNGSWTSVNPFSVNPLDDYQWMLTKVHFTSSNEGWATGVGGLFDGTNYSYVYGVLLHYYNGNWTNIDPLKISSKWYLTDVYFPSPQNGWAVGVDDEYYRGVLLHYLNGSWTSIPPPNTGSQYYRFISVHFTSSNLSGVSSPPLAARKYEYCN